MCQVIGTDVIAKLHSIQLQIGELIESGLLSGIAEELLSAGVETLNEAVFVQEEFAIFGVESVQ